MKLFPRLLLLSAVLFSVLTLTSCSSGQASIPVNKKEVMDRFVAGTLDPTYAPAAFFAHFGGGKKVGEPAVNAHLQFYLETNQDILKVQFEQSAPRIEELEDGKTDWMPEDFYRPTLEVCTRLHEIAGKDVYILPTIYNPYQVARQSLGEKRIVEAARNQPQALKNVLPALANEFIVLLKETSVAGYVAIKDLTKGGDIIRGATYSPFMPLIAVALIYLVLVVFFSWLVGKLERRLRNSDH